MNTKVSTWLFLVSGLLLIVGCGDGRSDWKDILRDRTVFSKEHLERLKERSSDIASGETEGVDFHIRATDGEKVGVDATEVERLYGSPTRVAAVEWGISRTTMAR